MVPAERSSSLVIRVLAVAKNRELNLCYPSLSPQGTKSLNHWSFEIGLCSGKGGGHGRLGRVETGLLSRNPPHRKQRSRPQHTVGASGSESLRIGETRNAPLLKSKSKRLLVLNPVH